MGDMNDAVTMVALHEENVKRIKVVEITFDPERKVMVLGGRNRQGKSSLIDGIAACLGGLKLCPEVPLREGTARGSVAITLSNGLVVERVFGKGEGLRITGPDGNKFGSPQAVLDALWSSTEAKVLAFDPAAFVDEPPLMQQEIVKELVGLTDAFKKLDGQRDEAFDNRTEANRNVKALEARLAALPTVMDPKTVPAEEVSIQGVLDEITKAERRNMQNMDLRNVARRAEERAWDAQKRVNELREALVAAEKLATQQEDQAGIVRAQAAGVQDVDVDPLRMKLGKAETVNKQVRVMKQRATISKELADAKGIADANDRQIAKIDGRKAELLAEAKMPVPGLAFTEMGMTLNGLPVKQASDAEKLELALAVAIGLTPHFRLLLVRRGSHLDDDALLRVCEVAQERNAQTIIERIGDVIPATIAGKVQTVILEDGAIAAEKEKP